MSLSLLLLATSALDAHNASAHTCTGQDTSAVLLHAGSRATFDTPFSPMALPPPSLSATQQPLPRLKPRPLAPVGRPLPNGLNPHTPCPASQPLAHNAAASRTHAPPPAAAAAKSKLAHLACERRRRENIQAGFDELRTILPYCDPASSKAAILKAASDYILALRQQVARKTSSSPASGERCPPVERDFEEDDIADPSLSSTKLQLQEALRQRSAIISTIQHASFLTAEQQAKLMEEFMLQHICLSARDPHHRPATPSSASSCSAPSPPDQSSDSER